MKRTFRDKLWYQSDPQGLPRMLRTCLRPVSVVYGALARPANQHKVQLTARVVSVGNLTVGGSGKTPVVIDLASKLVARGIRVGIAARRIGGGGETRICMPGQVPDAQYLGDEPALVAARVPEAAVASGRSKTEAARFLVDRAGVEIVLVDDGFQHRRLFRDLDILCVDARRGLGNGLVVPAGPLREPASAIARADAVFFTYSRGQTQQDLIEIAGKMGVPNNRPVFGCEVFSAGFVKGKTLLAANAPEGPVVAFCAIENPSGFDGLLRDSGLDVVHWLVKRDHHRWTHEEIVKLLRKAAEIGAVACVCTEKDLVKIDYEGAPIPVVAPRLELRWIQSDPLDYILYALD